MNKVVGYIQSNLWLMLQPDYDRMCLIAARRGDELESLLNAPKPESLLTRSGERMRGTRYVQNRSGVAVIDVNGVIAKRMNMFDEICEGGTSTELLAKDFQAALDSPEIHSIVFNIDSPGGEAFGVNEFANQVYAARGKKPIKAYVSGYGASAAYFIAAAADEVVADAQAILGSIGVVSEWQDPSEFYKMLGIDRKVVTSENAPKKRLDLNKPEDMNEFKSVLNAMEKPFIKAVGKFRGKSFEQVVEDFNKGGLCVGRDAVKAGMADRTGSLEEVIKELQLNNKKKKSAVSAAAEGDLEMGFKEEFKSFAAKLGFSVEEKPEQVEAGDAKPEAVTETALAEKQAAEEREAKAQSDLATLKAEQAEERQKQIESSAAAYVESEIKAGRLFPAEKESFTALYTQAATLEDASFLAMLKTNQSKRASHGLTDEVVDTEANQVLLAGAPAQTDEAKKVELMNKTPLGKAALKLVKDAQAASAK